MSIECLEGVWKVYQVRSSQDRSSQDRSGQVRTGQVRPGLVRAGQVRTGQVKTVRTGQVRAITFLDPKCALEWSVTHGPTSFFFRIFKSVCK